MYLPGLDNMEQRLRALQLLVYLLPTANRDTLFALLDFLNKVAINAFDTVDEDGNEVSIGFQSVMFKPQCHKAGFSQSPKPNLEKKWFLQSTPPNYK